MNEVITLNDTKVASLVAAPSVYSEVLSHKSLYSEFDELYERIMTELTYKPILEHKCNNCGAPLKMDAENHLFKCRYCGTAYLIGTNQIHG